MRQFAAAATVLIALAMPAIAEEPRIATLSAAGAGSVSVIPDIAIVTIGVVSRAETAREALDANNAELGKVIATILGGGIKERDVGTSGFSVNPIYKGKPYRSSTSDSDELPRVVGYQVSNEVRVTIRDIAESGAVLDKVVTAGANRISGIQFDISDAKAPSDEALKQAIAEARSKAELMAEAAGVRLVRILDINASSGVPAFARAEMRAASDSVPVMPGERQVTANANISWEIAPE
ncbi:MAG: SIMPL domain-containing protein [Bauldia sp.]|uniref:SIMPL domain-containing protein n=1 Tax=Bauldia sp. TaxID=2575872 RepID=UPI001D29EC46|nr:SIMPL domain-containing protein [Bauldia sp.]MCB1494771.1 SIMPL domain-containing protein [Bauldia sp.]